MTSQSTSHHCNKDICVELPGSLKGAQMCNLAISETSIKISAISEYVAKIYALLYNYTFVHLSPDSVL